RRRVMTRVARSSVTMMLPFGNQRSHVGLMNETVDRAAQPSVFQMKHCSRLLQCAKCRRMDELQDWHACRIM
ncbi:hypothetical protein, partial [Streptomyces sp. P17]|uniref:hypothetical protein n=1 Tax=Streptomyces sp. P17 TaxID=3074716 RepID=UPI0028F40BA5